MKSIKLSLNIKGKPREIKIKENNDHVTIQVEGEDFVFEKEEKKKEEEISVAQTSLPKKKFTKKKIKAPIAGTISKIFVEEGEKFKENQKIASLSAMKMENEIVSDFKGKVKEVLVEKNQKVKEGEVLVVLE